VARRPRVRLPHHREERARTRKAPSARPGGKLSTPDGVFTVTIPAGALAGDTQITIEEVASPAAGAIGKTYDIGPSGTQFAMPATLAFKYGGLDLQGNDPSSLEVATIVSGEWVALMGDAIDTSTQVVIGTTMHLSPYGIQAKKHGAGTDSGTGNDATTSDDGATSTDANDAGSSDAPFDAAGCTMKVYQVSSCANHPVQLGCPAGTFIGSCTDSMAAQRFTLECCTNDGG
jgi:hypothetical protein